MKILIGGDVIPTPVNFDLFEKSDLDALMGEALKRIWQDADFRIINLEAPFTDTQTPIAKLGPNLKAPKKNFPGTSGDESRSRRACQQSCDGLRRTGSARYYGDFEHT